jgi:23S rRNA (uracil1939-C5)-methyltransferase
MTAASGAGTVIGVELNPSAVKDAIANARRNQCRNITFVNEDAGVYMRRLAASPERPGVDVVFMDPPRSGSSREFLDALAALRPERIVYISCDPHTLGRDLKDLGLRGYRAVECQPVDMFPYTDDIENVVLLERIRGSYESKRKSDAVRSGNHRDQKKLRGPRAASGRGGKKASKPKPGQRGH